MNIKSQLFIAMLFGASIVFGIGSYQMKKIDSNFVSAYTDNEVTQPSSTYLSVR